jgi:P27 family predicted phage terminase small subunit
MAAGPRGPRPIPTHLKLLRGNPGRQKLNENEPQPEIPPNIPAPPAFLNGYALEEWHRVERELYALKLLTNVDINPLAAYCVAYQRWRDAEEMLHDMAKRDGVTRALLIKGTKGVAVRNPLVAVARQAALDMVRYASEFGLTPAARSRIAAGPFGETPVSKFDGLLA